MQSRKLAKKLQQNFTDINQTPNKPRDVNHRKRPIEAAFYLRTPWEDFLKLQRRDPRTKSEGEMDFFLFFLLFSRMGRKSKEQSRFE